MAENDKSDSVAADLPSAPAIGTPMLVSAPILACLMRARKKPTNRALGQLLAVLKVYRDLGMEVPKIFVEGSKGNVMVPIELIDMIGPALSRRGGWSHDQTRMKAEAASPKHRQWQAAAEEIWARHPDFTNSDVARLIEPESSDYVRQVIRKPQPSSP
jgi:hypothetical protein